MATTKLRRNPISGTIVLIAPDREKPLKMLRRQNPREWPPGVIKRITTNGCPFCPGNEKMTPPEIRAYRKEGAEKDEKGWWVRVVPNLNPAVDSSLPSALLLEEKEGPFPTIDAFGYHYLIVEFPEHNESLATIQLAQIREILSMWRDLTLEAGSKRNIKYAFLFENYGPKAGASQIHPHSQLIALPMIPTRIMVELQGSRHFYENNQKCFYCEDIEWEERMGDRIIKTGKNFVAWSPFTSKTPYQVVIAPRNHQSYFANISTEGAPIGNDHLTELASILHEVLKRIKTLLNDPDYNLYLHSAPTVEPELSYYHWHLQIEPVTEAIIAGFEKGSGAYINPKPPEKAAQELREVSII